MRKILYLIPMLAALAACSGQDGFPSGWLSRGDKQEGSAEAVVRAMRYVRANEGSMPVMKSRGYTWRGGDNRGGNSGGDGSQGNPGTGSPDSSGGGGFSVAAATKFIRTHAYPKYDKATCGYCARSVANALSVGGIDTSGRPGSAKDYGPYLIAWVFTRYQKKDMSIRQVT